MTRSDQEAVAKSLGIAAEVFNEALSDLRVEAYLEALADLDGPVLVAAIREAVRTKTFFPKPAELREIACGKPEDRADLAWVRLQRAFGVVGYYGQPDFSDDPALELAVKALGGWKAACSIEADQASYTAALFKRTYLAGERRHTADRLLLGPGLQVGLLGEGEP